MPNRCKDCIASENLGSYKLRDRALLLVQYSSVLQKGRRRQIASKCNRVAAAHVGVSWGLDVIFSATSTSPKSRSSSKTVTEFITAAKCHTVLPKLSVSRVDPPKRNNA